jgi:hypothetical protein
MQVNCSGPASAVASFLPSPENPAATCPQSGEAAIQWLLLHLALVTRIGLPSVVSPDSQLFLPPRSCLRWCSINPPFLQCHLIPSPQTPRPPSQIPSSSAQESHVVMVIRLPAVLCFLDLILQYICMSSLPSATC